MEIFSLSRWGAEPFDTDEPPKALVHPFGTVTIMNVYSDYRCENFVSFLQSFNFKNLINFNLDQIECSEELRGMQEEFNSGGFFNFVAGSYGVFEGRGWDVRSLKGYKDFVIAVIYTKSGDQKRNQDRLIADGQTIGKLAIELNIYYQNSD
jgi:hypothetical protein